MSNNKMAFDQFMQDMKQDQAEQFMDALSHDDLAEGSGGGVMNFRPSPPSDGSYDYEYEQFKSEFPEEHPWPK